MQTIERAPQRGLWHEEMNRTRQEIQSRWNEAERIHRRQMAECRQRALLELLSLAPVNRERAPQAV